MLIKLKDAHKSVNRLLRRQTWFIRQLTIRKLLNMLLASIDFFFKSKVVHAYPVALKIDISPLCNIHCSVCIHSNDKNNKALENQVFNSQMKMSLDEYSKIINEVKGKVSALSLYYLGDPLIHPNLSRMCRMAKDAGINTHISTNLSFQWSDEKLKELVLSGITDLTVCVDGLTQETYSKTRIGGRIDYVIPNLKRIIEIKNEHKLSYPRVEVQYIKYEHNIHELDKAKKIFAEIGVDQIVDFNGALHNYTDFGLDNLKVYGVKSSKIKRCYQLYFMMVIKYNGDVIPCCTHRFDEQYNREKKPLVLGNVFQSNVIDVWNSEEYKTHRAIARNPKKYKGEINIDEFFCYGCNIIYNTNSKNLKRYYTAKIA